MSYETAETDVAVWAAEQGRSEYELLNFREYAAYFFAGRNDSSYPGADEEMMTFLREINTAYFSGNLENAAAFDPDGSVTARWDAVDPMMGYYLRSIQGDFGQNYNYWQK